MYRGEDVLKVRELFVKGLSKSAIADKLGIDRKTVTRLLQESPTRSYRRDATLKRVSKLDPYKEYIQRRVVEDGVTNAQVILREIRSQGYQGGYTVLKDFLNVNSKVYQHDGEKVYHLRRCVSVRRLRVFCGGKGLSEPVAVSVHYE